MINYQMWTDGQVDLLEEQRALCDVLNGVMGLNFRFHQAQSVIL